MSKKNKKKADIVVNLLDIVIIIMVFVILYVGFSLKISIDFAKESSTFMQDADRMSFELSNNNYALLVQGKYVNEINGNTESEAYHMLANYVEAVSKYKVYEKKGYDERADKQKAIMDDARKKLDKMTIFADRIDKMFGIE